jgi:uncharacterized repeat protein (TIGR01451 family)
LRSAPAPVAIAASIDIEKTVFLGRGTESECNDGLNLLTGSMDDKVTYCFKVTNTGSENLASVEVEDSELNFNNESIGALAPGETKTVLKKSKANK